MTIFDIQLPWIPHFDFASGVPAGDIQWRYSMWDIVVWRYSICDALNIGIRISLYGGIQYPMFWIPLFDIAFGCCLMWPEAIFDGEIAYNIEVSDKRYSMSFPSLGIEYRHDGDTGDMQ